MKYTLEICSNSVQSALNARDAGATRVELCDNLWEAGTTPSYGTIKKARELLNIQLFVLIRPRGGDFYYSQTEFDVIREDIIACKALGVDGIVSGVLKADATIDVVRTKELIELSLPLPFTFHRAFDITNNLFQSLEELLALRVDRILTSGGGKCAADVHKVIAELNRLVDNNIHIMPSGGVNENNIGQLFPTGCPEFHITGNALCISKAKAASPKLNGNPAIPESDYFQSSIRSIQEVILQLENNFNA